MGRFTGILGILTMLGLAFAFSTNRRAIRVKTVAWGLGLQAAFAVFVLKADIGRRVFQKAGDAVNRLLSYAFAGSSFVFGDLGKSRLPPWLLLRFSSSADGHFHRSVFCRAVPLWGDAVHHQASRASHDELYGRQRCGVAQCRGQHLHGTD